MSTKNTSSAVDLPAEVDSRTMRGQKGKKLFISIGAIFVVCAVCLVFVLSVNFAKTPETHEKSDTVIEDSRVNCLLKDESVIEIKQTAAEDNDSSEVSTIQEIASTQPTQNNAISSNTITDNRIDLINPSIDDVTEPSQPASSAQPASVLIYEEYPCFNGYEEYEEALKSMKLPENFISFEQIKELGTFRNMVLDFFPQYEEFGSYSYMVYVNSSDKTSLTVRIRPVPDTISSETVIADSKINAADLRHLKTNDSGVYVINGASYKYSRGELDSISFVVNGMYVSIVQPGVGTWSKIQLKTGTMLTGLLNVETARDSIENLKNSVAK